MKPSTNDLGRLLPLLVALTLAATACSGSDTTDPAQGDGTRLGSEDGRGSKGKGGNAKKGARKPGGSKESGGADAGSGRPVPSPPPAAAGAPMAPKGNAFIKKGPPSPVDPSLARRSSSVEDPSGDAQKEGALVPAHSEILGCEIVGLGREFEMRFHFGGQVPERTEDKNTVMVIGFGISVGGNESYGFTAQGNQEGWKAYAGAKDGARRFPGRFLIEGDTIVMRVPWDFIEGPREFKYQANATWFRSVANTTHYSFDMCPNDKAGNFPG
jgi:hypothetical protein